MFRSYMFEQALKREDKPLARPLDGPTNTDVCIVGGGYTGLWTAIDLKKRKPDLDM